MISYENRFNEKMKSIIVLLNIFSVYLCSNVRMSTEPPLTLNNLTLSAHQVPQFVMLTYDDAVNIANFPTYMHLFDKRNRKNACPIGATFFITHENTDYHLIHELHRRGHEIAVHSITHQSNTQYWKAIDKNQLINEIDGMREIISRFAEIDVNDIRGYRAPFLQTNGNMTFQVLKDKGFLYDSSMPTLQHSKPKPIYPYTLDNGYEQDCQIAPCPTDDARYNGLFEVPLVDHWRKRLIIDGPPPVYADSPCAMSDFCLPAPVDEEDTFQYFKDNFDRHYRTNRAPFPLFLHEAWLSTEAHRLQGYLQFIDYLNEFEDVFVVTIQEMLHWMANPVPVEEYRQQRCERNPAPSVCPSPSLVCQYKKVPEFHNNDKQMVICGNKSKCPHNYPWVTNISGA